MNMVTIYNLQWTAIMKNSYWVSYQTSVPVKAVTKSLGGGTAVAQLPFVLVFLVNNLLINHCESKGIVLTLVHSRHRPGFHARLHCWGSS
jgi:hypothetical protein